MHDATMGILFVNVPECPESKFRMVKQGASLYTFTHSNATVSYALIRLGRVEDALTIQNTRLDLAL